MAITINKIIGNKIIVNTKPQLTELCFTAEEANSSVKLQKQGSTAIEGFNGLEYKKVSATQLLAASSDEWKPYTIGTFGENNELSGLNVGDKVYMRAVASGNSRMGMKYSNYHQFVMTGKIAASGNVNTLLNPDPNADVSLAGKNYCYSRMFHNCSSLTQAPELPATTLATNCYYYMFYSCTSLTQAPELPSTTLADNCYSYMFCGCTSLTQAPELPATTLASYCYYYIFNGCSSLKQAPALPATTLTTYCYNSMFSECTSLTQAPALPATTLADECYSYMFSYCSSLTQAPALPATTLADNCYDYMLGDCSKFSEVHMKSSMNGVYNTSTHGDTTKTVIYDL